MTELIDDILQNRYPKQYNIFIKLYLINVRTLLCVFLKRMRRHYNFPRHGYFAPIYDLRTEEVTYGMRFDIKTNGDVLVSYFSVESQTIYREEICKDIQEAWHIYKNNIIEMMEKY